MYIAEAHSEPGQMPNILTKSSILGAGYMEIFSPDWNSNPLNRDEISQQNKNRIYMQNFHHSKPS